jgi:hypothetical protein
MLSSQTGEPSGDQDLSGHLYSMRTPEGNIAEVTDGDVAVSSDEPIAPWCVVTDSAWCADACVEGCTVRMAADPD